MGIFKRLWVGIVGAMTGTSLAIVVQVVGKLSVGLPIKYLGIIVLYLALVGFIFGFAVGDFRIGGSKDKDNMDK
jgi:hypothetical protein